VKYQRFKLLITQDDLDKLNDDEFLEVWEALRIIVNNKRIAEKRKNKICIT